MGVQRDDTQTRNDGSDLLTSKVVAGAGAAANAPESGLVGDSWSSSSSELAIGFMTRDMLLRAHTRLHPWHRERVRGTRPLSLSAARRNPHRRSQAARQRCRSIARGL